MSTEEKRIKPIVGQRLYSLNVGNAARRGVEQVLTPVTVLSVGRKYFTAAADESRMPVEYHLSTWKENTNYCANSQLYENPKDWEDEKETETITSEIRKAFEVLGPCKLSLQQLRDILKIIHSSPSGEP